MQPAVAIPSGVRFWGVDSGVRHSVGGSDYGSVRCAAFAHPNPHPHPHPHPHPNPSPNPNPRSQVRCAAFMGRAILRWVQR